MRNVLTRAFAFCACVHVRSCGGVTIVFWDALTFAVILPILYTATIMPFEIFFVEDTGPWLPADVTITVLFFLDMVMNVNIGYYDVAGFPVSSR